MESLSKVSSALGSGLKSSGKLFPGCREYAATDAFPHAGFYY